MKSGAAALPAEVFISHASGNRKFVDKLCQELSQHSVPYWYSKRNIRGAAQWHDEIGDALARCDWFILVLSPEAVRSKWVKHELFFALNDSRYELRIVPCILKKCNVNKLSWTLSSFQHVNFEKSFEHGIRDLLKIWWIGYRQSLGKTPTKVTNAKSAKSKRKRPKI